jgi:hypothetical protein
MDWQDDIFGTGVTTNNRVAFSGRNENQIIISLPVI